MHFQYEEQALLQEERQTKTVAGKLMFILMNEE